jgi:hypothetical protein
MNNENVQNGTDSDGFISVGNRKWNKECTGITVPADGKKERKVPDGEKSVNDHLRKIANKVLDQNYPVVAKNNFS